MFLTQSQLGVYLACKADKSRPVYLIPSFTLLASDTDTDQFIQAVNTALKAHSAARLRITLAPDGTPTQWLAPEATQMRIQHLSAEEFAALRTTLPHPVDIDAGDPLIDIRLFILSNGERWFYQMWHHILCDGASAEIFANSVAIAQKGRTPTEPLTLLHLAEQEEALRNSPLFAQEKEWFATTFGDAETLSMPLSDINSHSPQGQQPQGARATLTLSTPFLQAHAAAQDKGVKLPVLLNAAFALTIGRFAGETKAQYLTIVAGRTQPDHLKVMSMMVRTLPVFATWDNPQCTVDEFLHTLAQQYHTASQTQAYSILDAHADLSLNTNLLFAYRGKYHGNNLPFGGGKSQCIDLRGSGNDMTFVLDHTDDTLTLSADYRADHYSAALINSILKAYNHTLAQMLTAAQLSDITLIDTHTQRAADEAHHIPHPLPTHTIPQRFAHQAAQTPQATAIVSGHTRLTYAQLHNASSRLAAQLRTLGVKKGQVVSILIPRTELMAICSIAVLKTGAAYQPLDPTYPTERLQFMTTDAAATVLIAHPDMAGLIPEFKGKVISTDEIDTTDTTPAGTHGDASPRGRSREGEDTLNEASLDDPFVLIYTSGSTGTPKGCILTHRSVAAFVSMAQQVLHYDSTTHAAAYASYGFDASLWDHYPALTSGGTVHVIGEDIRFDLVKLNDYFTREQITHAFMTTQVGRAYITSVDAPPSLRYLSTGGEALAPIAPPQSYTVYNMYGPTETTVIVTGQPLDQLYDRVPIGHALPGTRLYVVDPHGHLQPNGAIGELWISGPQLAAGYLHQPEKTTQVFVPNPFCSEPFHTKAYRTGDIVRRLPDGRIDFIGRRDGQVKVRGFRIELSEIEQVIRQYPGISNATVQAFDDPAGGKSVCAYIVSPQPIDTAALAAFIRERKPPYMVPAATMQIDAIPLNQNQKVNRRALPQPDFSSPASTTTAAPRPANALERALQEVVESVIHRANVDPATPLHHVGLTSISAIRLAIGIYKRFHIEVDSTNLQDDTSIATIANLILEQWMKAKDAPAAPADAPATPADAPVAPATPATPATPSPTEATEAPFPLTIAQQGIYAECMRHPGTILYNIPLLLRFHAQQDCHQLEQAVRTVMAHHSQLHAHLVLEGDDVAQTIPATHSTPITHSTLSEQDFAAHRAAFVQPFDLMQGPLFRIEIVQTEAAVYLLLDAHHIVFDGSSFDIVAREICALLNGQALSNDSDTYAQYAAWEQSIDKSAARDFFAHMLRHCEAATEIAPNLPHSNPDEWGEAATAAAPLPIQAMENFARAHSLTPAALVLAATGYALARFSNASDAYISMVSAGRATARHAATVGMLVKTLPVAICMGNNLSRLDFVKQTAATLRAVVEHEVYPYAQICQDHNYAPHIIFGYQLGLVEPLQAGGQPVAQEIIIPEVLKARLAVFAELHEGKPSVVIKYAAKCYSQLFMARLANGIVEAIGQILAEANAPVRSLSLVSAADRAKLAAFGTVDANAQPAFGTVDANGQPAAQLFHQAFETCVDSAPEKEILAAADGHFTYAALESRANSVAQALLQKGLQKGEPVVVLLGRTSRFFAAVFGISKAGGVFIPSSPEYPEERIRTILEDSGARFLITEGDALSTYAHMSLDIAQLLNHPNTKRPAVDISPNDLCYMIYTSGSTGKPKGVELRHRNICNFLTPHPANPQVSLSRQLGTTKTSIITTAFDGSFNEWAVSLCNSIRLVFASDKETLDPSLLAQRMEQEGVELFECTPSRLLQYLELEAFRRAIGKCKMIICGGEAFSDKLLSELRRHTSARIFNAYGPTETTVASNFAELTHAALVTVGKPLLGYTEWIVDTDNNILPPGVIGELLIGGAGVGKGYHNLPEKTAEAFITYHHTPAYRSGDYARWNEDGTVQVFGRRDNQVKLRGLRIELGEVESVLTSVAGVASGTVLIRRVGKEDALCAYYTLEPNCTLSAEALRNAMAERLTPYMVPTAFMALAALPITPNGKVDTRALPQPEALTRKAGRVAQTDGERFFCTVFAKIVGEETVYADDNFFDIGGSSLTVTRIIIAAQERGLALAYADVFTHPTPQQLAALIFGAEAAPESEADDEFEDLSQYDYTAINTLLAGNTLDAFRAGTIDMPKHVLLTGAVGFLGIHVLCELLTHYPHTTITCLLRGRGHITAADRLETMYFYYFEKDLNQDYAGRVLVVEGDITSSNWFDKAGAANMVINCAANVKHFSAGSDIEDVNFHGVENLIAFCERYKARLIQVSTVSVGGVFYDCDAAPSPFAEQALYIGQRQMSIYTQSKFMAERALLQAVTDGRISGKVMRVGNLAPRDPDGEYQVNLNTNSFMARVKSAKLVGMHAFEEEQALFELSPIDAVAQAVVLLSAAPDACVVFHPYNNHALLQSDLYASMNKLGLATTGVEAAEYDAAFAQACDDPAKASALTGLLAYRHVGTRRVNYTAPAMTYTISVLARMGFRWPATSNAYMERFLAALKGLGFFNN